MMNISITMLDIIKIGVCEKLSLFCTVIIPFEFKKYKRHTPKLLIKWHIIGIIKFFVAINRWPRKHDKTNRGRKENISKCIKEKNTEVSMIARIEFLQSSLK